MALRLRVQVRRIARQKEQIQLALGGGDVVADEGALGVNSLRTAATTRLFDPMG